MASRFIKVLLFFCFIVYIMSACFLNPPEKHIKLPQTSYLTGVYGWGVIIDPYASFVDTPGSLGIIVSHGRRGDILALTARKMINNGNQSTIWFKFEQGWLPESSVSIYANIYQAQHASENIQ